MMPKPRGKRRQVALIYDATRAYDIKVMTGVAAYLREGTSWSVYIEETALKDQKLPSLRNWRGDGVIANFDDPKVVSAVVESRLPAVAFGSGYGWYDPKYRIPYFFTNNRAIADLAADHLLEHGFRHFAYYGGMQTRTTGWSDERERAFGDRLKKRGFGCSVYRDKQHLARHSAQREMNLGQWLSALPKPFGLMAENDQGARLALEVCRSAGLRVPDDVAVVGVDNDELLCHLSTPLLSSVEQGSRQIGYEAAALLDRIMMGHRPKRLSVVIDPVGIIARASTDTLAIEDGTVATAMRYIAEHATLGIRPRQVSASAGISRSGLEARFKRVIGKSIKTAIRSAQLARLTELVRDTGVSLKEIAAMTGFKSVQHMTTVFREKYGTPPAEYRREMRVAGGF
jgi:LacI family transcriptional regulator